MVASSPGWPRRQGGRASRQPGSGGPVWFAAMLKNPYVYRGKWPPPQCGGVVGLVDESRAGTSAERAASSTSWSMPAGIRIVLQRAPR